MLAAPERGIDGSFSFSINFFFHVYIVRLTMLAKILTSQIVFLSLVYFY